MTVWSSTKSDRRYFTAKGQTENKVSAKQNANSTVNCVNNSGSRFWKLVCIMHSSPLSVLKAANFLKRILYFSVKSVKFIKVIELLGDSKVDQDLHCKQFKTILRKSETEKIQAPGQSRKRCHARMREIQTIYTSLKLFKCLSMHETLRLTNIFMV